MEKLNNWNAWCNDKVLLHNEEGFPILLSPNAILGIEQAEGNSTDIAMVDGIFFTVKETVEEILALIGELIKESEARRAEQAEEQRKQYEEMQKAAQAEQKASEG